MRYTTLDPTHAYDTHHLIAVVEIDAPPPLPFIFLEDALDVLAVAVDYRRLELLVLLQQHSATQCCLSATSKATRHHEFANEK